MDEDEVSLYPGRCTPPKARRNSYPKNDGPAGTHVGASLAILRK